MSVSLQKGQGVSLQKQNGQQLTLVRMGVGWDPIKKRGLFGSRDLEVDLDASAVLFADHQPVDIALQPPAQQRRLDHAHRGQPHRGRRW